MSGERITVIIPVKNEAEKIERCLEAVFNQTLKPFEVIVPHHISHNIFGIIFTKFSYIGRKNFDMCKVR